MKCPNCGADTTGKICTYCGGEILREQQTINITNNYYGNVSSHMENSTTTSATCPKCNSAKINFKREKIGTDVQSRSHSKRNEKRRKRRSMSRSEYRTIGLCQNCGYTWSPQGDEDWAISETEGRIVPKWLWVLGWICIFPLPLTIIILRKKDIKQELKYGIIVIAWVAYVLLALFADNDKDADSTPDAVSWHKENVQVECLRDEPEEDFLPISFI